MRTKTIICDIENSGVFKVIAPLSARFVRIEKDYPLGNTRVKFFRSAKNAENNVADKFSREYLTFDNFELYWMRRGQK